MKSSLSNFQAASGRAWRNRLTPAQDAAALAIMQQTDLPDVLSRVLAARGITAADAERYLNPALRDLMPDPDTLTDMGPLVARFVAAVQASEKIAIFGDYDVDGACSAALLWQYLDAAGCECIVHIPDRLTEGYGPNIQAIQSFKQLGARLVVTVDCGTTSFEPFETAQQLGMDVLVIDHHQAPELLPRVTALVNPNRLDDLSNLGHLCAAGVVYLVIIALHRALRDKGFWQDKTPPDLLEALDLVALATVADVVPLKGLNRAYVVKGLAVMKARARTGLRALMDVARMDAPPAPYHLGFLLGPRINAGGRIGDAAMGVRLLTTRDDAEANRLAQELDTLNRERQALEALALIEAEASALAQAGLSQTTDTVLIVGEDGWHPGIVGLVSARLKERYTLPAFAIAWNGHTGTGSGRSIPGVDLGNAVRAAADSGVITKGGGHAMAAGLTLERNQLEAFSRFIRDRLRSAITTAKSDAALLIDAVIQPAAISLDLLKSLEKAGPFGSGSSEPVFVVPNLRILDVVPVGSAHYRIRARAANGGQIKAMAFRAVGSPLGDALVQAKSGTAIALAGTLSINHWNGREEVQFRVIDLALMG